MGLFAFNQARRVAAQREAEAAADPVDVEAPKPQPAPKAAAIKRPAKNKKNED